MNFDFKRGLEYHKKGQLDEAEQVYLNFSKENEKNAEVLQLLGTLYLQKKNYPLSEKYFLKTLEIEPNNPNALNNLGILNKQIKEINKSIEYFDLNIDKNNFLNSWINKSNILLENKKFE